MNAYQSARPGDAVSREIEGPLLFGAGESHLTRRLRVPGPYAGNGFAWGSNEPGTYALALAVLADCLGEAGPALETESWRLHDALAVEILTDLDQTEPLHLDWEDVRRWVFQRRGGEPDALLTVLDDVRRFESRLRAARQAAGARVTHRFIEPALWEQWDLESLFHVAVVRGTFPPDHLPSLLYCLMDVKFKLYCLLEVDLPAYRAAIEATGLDTDDPALSPEGLVTQLSTSSTVVIKARAVWESVMNAVHVAEEGTLPGTKTTLDDDGTSRKSKAAPFFRWVKEQPRWASLSTFEPLVRSLESARSAELHKNSQLRARFVRGELAPTRPLLELVNAVIHFVWDHIVMVAVVGRESITYDASSGAGMVVDVTDPANSP